MKISAVLVSTFVMFMSVANVFGAIITLPTSLNPGDSYRLAFVTSAGRNGHSAFIGDYNIL